MIRSTIFICQLTDEIQEEIRRALYVNLIIEGFFGEKLDEIVNNAMDDRLYNLSDTIDITPYLRGEVIK